MSILNELFENADSDYKSFQSSLVPGIKNILGVRAPIVKRIAKKYANTDTGEAFLKDLPHKYFDENMVHAYMFGYLKCDFEVLKDRLIDFLPHMDNWNVVDSCAQNLKKIFKNRDRVYDFVKNMSASSKTYISRFGLVCMLDYYIDAIYIDDVLDTVKNIKNDEYYVKMAQAWLVSVAIVKQYEKAVALIENKELDKWVHNKSISKSIESFRVPNERKEYLKGLRIK